MEIEGVAISLNKKMKDGRKSPKAMLVPDDEDVFIFDQHREEKTLSDGTKVDVTVLGDIMGVMKNHKITEDKIEFDWVVTDPKLEKTLKHSKHPEKLLKYSGEHIAYNKTDEYPQGELGILQGIAITNIGNDDEAITTRIKNMANAFLNNVKGEDMKEEDVTKIVNEKIEEAKTQMASTISDEMGKIKIPEIDTEKLEKVFAVVEKLGEIPDKVESLEKNMQKITSGIEEEKTETIKNIVANSKFTKEELENMSMESLKSLTKTLNIKNAVSGSNDTNKKDIIDVVCEELGLDPKEEGLKE